MFFGRSNRLKADLAKAQERIAALKQDKAALQAKLQSARDQIQAMRAPGIPLDQLAYNADGLSVWGKNLSFMTEDRFLSAYRKGQLSGHKFSGNAQEFHVEWRVHVILWAAQIGMKLEGDFVECGVNTGIFSLAIADYLDFGSRDRTFYLFDTFCGTPEDQMAEEEKEKRLRDNQVYYPDCYEQAKANFAPYPNMVLVRGRVPETLTRERIDRVAYLSIDMNVAEAEVAAMEFFWDKLQTGAPVVLDDYAWTGCETQKAALDRFAEGVGVPIVTLPTGQGLLFKM
jgi:hypothetical protein